MTRIWAHARLPRQQRLSGKFSCPYEMCIVSVRSNHSACCYLRTNLPDVLTNPLFAYSSCFRKQCFSNSKCGVIFKAPWKESNSTLYSQQAFRGLILNKLAQKKIQGLGIGLCGREHLSSVSKALSSIHSTAQTNK